MNLDLFKNIAEQIKKDNNVKEFMQDLSNSLENPNQSQELQENRKEGHLYLVTEDRNGEVYLWDFTDKPKHEFKEVITSDELLKVAKEGAMLQYKNGKYEPLPLVQAVEVCKQLVRMFADKKIEVIRVGLQNTEEISEPGSNQSEVVAGPFHPAFRQLVESSMWYDAIVEKIKKLNVKVKEVEVTVNPIDANNVIGHKRENIKKLKDFYEVDLKVKQDASIKQGKSKIEITKQYNDFLDENK